MDIAAGLGLTASRLVILRRRLFSVTVTRWFSASFCKVAGFFAPAAAHGLPDWPFLKPACRGGLP